MTHEWKMIWLVVTVTVVALFIAFLFAPDRVHVIEFEQPPTQGVSR